MLRHITAAAVILLAATTTLVSARPSPAAMAAPRQEAEGTDIELCTLASYATGGCPYAAPTAGAGTCGTFTVQPSTCYTFANFTSTPTELIGNINFISIPSDASITGCNLYKTLDCTVTPDEEWDACEVGDTDLTCRKHLAGGITSFVCA